MLDAGPRGPTLPRHGHPTDHRRLRRLPADRARDAAAIAEAGFDTVICNRPDAEVPAELSAEALRAAVEAQGLRFVELPATRETIDDALIAAQREAARGGRTLAYCASGTRCSVIWALGEAGSRPADAILEAAARAGYDLAPLRPRIEERAAR